MSDLIIMCGLPGSGKSTIAKKIKDSIIISTDDIREEINGDASNQDNASRVFEIAFSRIKTNLIKKEYKNVIFDATNINYKKRRDLINKFKKDANKIKCIFVFADYKECLERNKKRDRVVPKEVIKSMYYSFYVPQKFEGFDEIEVIDTMSIKEHEEKIQLLSQKLNINQNNPNHKLSLQEHSIKAFIYLMTKYNNTPLIAASFLHDIGKIRTKTFVNNKGETTDIAHYYFHENVGAYDSFIYTYKFSLEERLYIAKLIQWHMLLYRELSDKTIQKYKNLFGEDFWKDLNLLHESDLYAH